MKHYYIHNGSVQEGPFTIDELKKKNLSPGTPIWHEALSDWTTVDKITELHVASRPVPPPFQTINHTVPVSDFFLPERNRSLLIPLTISGVVLCLGLLGFFIYNNTVSSKELNEIKQAHISISEKQSQEESERLTQEARRKAINEELTRKNRAYRNNWSSYIFIGEVYADIDKFWGGVKTFDIPVTNSTDYMLDEVELSVYYIKDNGTLYKSETVRIYNIPANSAKSGQAPSSPRGTEINYEITGIVSKKMHFCYPVNNGNPEDPFFCR